LHWLKPLTTKAINTEGTKDTKAQKERLRKEDSETEENHEKAT
jgi:hypothetical protein